MRVFVTGTGRCGSVSFAAACAHIRNYTSAHETPTTSLIFPDKHIEVNPQLRHVISIVNEKNPQAFWVHLIRDRQSCVESLAALDHGEIMKAYWRLYYTILGVDYDSLLVADRYYTVENRTIDHQLTNRRGMKFFLNEWQRDWPLFCSLIGADVNEDAAINEWTIPKNTRQERGEPCELY